MSYEEGKIYDHSCGFEILMDSYGHFGSSMMQHLGIWNQQDLVSNLESKMNSEPPKAYEIQVFGNKSHTFLRSHVFLFVGSSLSIRINQSDPQLTTDVDESVESRPRCPSPIWDFYTFESWRWKTRCLTRWMSWDVEMMGRWTFFWVGWAEVEGW